MTLSDAANLITVQQGEKAILEDSSLSMWGKARALTAIQNAAAASPEPGHITPGDVMRGAIGAGIGYGAASLMGSMLGLSPSTLSAARSVGVGLGTLINTGLIMNKNSSDNDMQARRDAFRLGFCKAAMDLGLIKEGGWVATLPLTDVVKAPIDLGTNLAGSVATTGGALAGHIMGEDSNDVDLTQMGLEQRQLEAKADQLESGRRAAAVKRVLDKRLGRR